MQYTITIFSFVLALLGGDLGWLLFSHLIPRVAVVL